MLSSACSWNSCQSPMRWPGARASGNSRGYSMKPVGLPMNQPLINSAPKSCEARFSVFFPKSAELSEAFFPFQDSGGDASYGDQPKARAEEPHLLEADHPLMGSLLPGRTGRNLRAIHISGHSKMSPCHSMEA